MEAKVIARGGGFLRKDAFISQNGLSLQKELYDEGSRKV
jgi:hypothetical protein